ncbi:hypothetical protein [Marinoscillum pacificum]|uniref:hypothetical protein n=1 Tax=Marinoscillum pacificum TaxID=392723 RepID=UPI002158279E|nr:hypothetical protein [Marinoscillum pacificum]
MAKKVVINLRYSQNKLWWSADDKTNWGIVGPQSPYTVVNSGSDIDWIGDKTIDEVTITPKTGDLFESISGGKKDKKGKVKKSCKTGDTCKYDITVVLAGSKKTITVDPDMDICDEEDSNNCAQP